MSIILYFNENLYTKYPGNFPMDLNREYESITCLIECPIFGSQYPHPQSPGKKLNCNKIAC